MQVIFKKTDKTPIFWASNDPEELSLETPEEAIEETVNNAEGESVIDCIKSICPLEVKGYAPFVVDEEWIRSLSESAVESFLENINSEYGNPDGDSILSKDVEKHLIEEVTKLFVVSIPVMKVWTCEEVEHRVYTAEEVEEILRRESPEMFDDGDFGK